MYGKDYEMLCSLRKNLIQLEETKKTLEKTKRDNPYPDHPVTDVDQKLKHELKVLSNLEEKYYEPYHAKVKAKARSIFPWLLLLNIGAILLLVAAIAVSVVMKFGYEIFHKYHWGWWVEYDQIGYTALLIIGGGVSLLLFSLFFDDRLVYLEIPNFIFFSLRIIAILILVGGGIYYYLDFASALGMHGWWHILAPLLIWIALPIGALYTLPPLLYAFALTAVFFVVIGATLLLLELVLEILPVSYCTDWAEDRVPEPAIEALYETKEYMAAKKRYEDARENYMASPEYLKKIADYEEKYGRICRLINSLESRVWNLEKSVTSAPIQKDYKTVRMVNNLLYYFEYNRADTLKEAVNEYVHDRQERARRDQLKLNHQQQMAALNKVREEYQEGIERLIQSQNDATEAKLDAAQKISDDLRSLQKVQQKMEQDQWGRSRTVEQIQKDVEQIRMEVKK